MRTFLAIEMSEGIRKAVNTVIQDEKKKNLPIKWVEFENLHITLKFLGEIDDQKKNEIMPLITEITRGFIPFTVSLSGIGCFPGPRNPRVIWVGVQEGGEKMIELAERLENNLARIGFKKEEKKFHPHLTFGRVKGYCNVDEILAKTLAPEPFTVDSITLFKSTLKPGGPVYEGLQRFRFG